jgi:hypothetical protein
VVVAALAAEDEQIILDFLRRHGVEPEQPPATNADAISDSQRNMEMKENSNDYARHARKPPSSGRPLPD